MFRRLWDVLNKYKAELVVSSSMVDEGNDNRFYGAKQKISPAPFQGQMDHK